MVKRTVSGAVLVLLLLFLGIYGGIPLQAATLVCILIGMYEVYTALSGSALKIHWIGYLFAVLYVVFITFFTKRNGMMILIALMLLSSLVSLVVFHKRVSVKDIIVTVFGFLYVAILMSCVYLVRASDGGLYTVWLIFISAWGCDTGAYLVGRSIGKHKLVNTPSPGKTVEGVIGGVVVAALLGGLYAYGLQFFLDIVTMQSIPRFAAIAAVGGVLAQFGDLSASAIKRYTNIKDFGNIIPGHGGIIDRFDSVLFTAPIVYTMVLLVKAII